jgi:hypothetical protein
VTDTDKSDRLLSKADALLDRYRPSAAQPAGAPTASADLDFPVLTEVVALPGFAAEQGPEASATAATDIIHDTAPEASTSLPKESGALSHATAPEIDATKLREEILATLSPELEQRLADTLKPRANELLDWAMQTVQLELGLSIRAAVRSAVAEAVNESLERLKRERETRNTPP